MLFTETPLGGAYVIDLELRRDQRGFFSRTFCAREFAEHGLKATVAQCNLSYSAKVGVLRGMHYQAPPAAENKLVRCTRGIIHDVIIDLRPNSPTYLRHFAIELSDENRRALYVPEMFAHGFLTLASDTEVVYQMSEFYTPGFERGLRYDDPAFGIEWPMAVTEISDKDAAWPLLDRAGVIA